MSSAFWLPKRELPSLRIKRIPVRAFIRSVKKQDFGLSSGKPAHPHAAAKRTTLNPLISSLRIRWSEAPCRAPFDCQKETFQAAAQRASPHAFFCSLKKAIFQLETAKKAFKRRAPSCPKRKNGPPDANRAGQAVTPCIFKRTTLTPRPWTPRPRRPRPRLRPAPARRRCCPR